MIRDDSPKTRVCHINEGLADAIYIGRANHRAQVSESVFHNPFVVGKHGSHAQVIRMFAQYMDTRRDLWWMLPNLRNHPLACWCRKSHEPRTEDNACHGDVLVDLLETYTDDELRAMGVQP